MPRDKTKELFVSAAHKPLVSVHIDIDRRQRETSLLKLKELTELLLNTFQCSPPLCQVTVLLYTTQRNSRDKYRHLT